MVEENHSKDPSPQISPARRPSFADLTFRDVWHLVKYYFKAAFAFGLVFGLPYVLLFGVGLDVIATIGIESGSYRWWVNILLLGALILVILIELPDFLERFGSFLIEMGQAARRASFFKRTTALLLFVSWMFLGRKFPTPTFFFTIFVVFPIGFTIDEYNKLMKNKACEGEEAG